MSCVVFAVRAVTYRSAVSTLVSPLSPGLLSFSRSLNLTPWGVKDWVSPRL